MMRLTLHVHELLRVGFGGYCHILLKRLPNNRQREQCYLLYPKDPCYCTIYILLMDTLQTSDYIRTMLPHTCIRKKMLNMLPSIYSDSITIIFDIY